MSEFSLDGSEQSIEEILFEAAITKTTPEKRAAFLDAACRDDADLRSRLELLLEGYFNGEGFLSEAPEREEPSASEAPSPTTKLITETIGRYKLLEKIGEGGFGEVWMAEQRTPVKRRAALKIIKLGMDSKQVVARFEAERQAMALMDHPNIAKIFDADVTETGRPYFVMELVRGMKITDYCDKCKLSAKERLELFVSVCHAIQHAHQKGIIHRDIKPSNILITLHDGVPVPKVIDFGIAKAMQQELTDKTMFTHFQQFVGTPAYISPEQAEMSGLDIDTRADIYSLGVLLYELLVGQTPFDPKDMVKDGIDALRKMISEKEPTRPSNLLATLPDAMRTTAGKQRQTEVGALVHQLRGDLTGSMKCLEKDRKRRYDSACGLAADIQRHLAMEPIVARPPSTAYRIRKAWQRNKLALSSAALVFVALLGGAGVASWQAVVATRAKIKAEVNETAAVEAKREQGILREQAENASRRAQLAQQEAEAKAKEARRIAYASDMNVLQRELNRGNLGRAREILDRNRPQADGDEDLRGWEWRHLWLQCQGTPHRQFFAGEKPIGGLSVSYDGKLTAVSSGGTVDILDTESGREIASWQGVHALFSPASPWLVYWSDGDNLQDGKLGAGQEGFRLWNVATKTVEHFLPVNGYFYKGVAFSGDGSVLAVATTDYNRGEEKRILLWEIPSGERLKAIPADYVGPGSSYSFDLSQDGQLAAHGVLSGDLGFIRIVDVKTEKEQWKAEPHRIGEWVERLKFSPDGSILAVAIGTSTKEVQLWDVRAGRLLGELKGHTEYVKDLLFTPDGKRLISASADQSIRIWDLTDPDNFPSTSTVLRGHTDEVTRLAWHPDGKTLLSGGGDGQVLAWSMNEESIKRAHVSSTDATIVGWPLQADHSTQEATFLPEAWGTARVLTKAVSPNGTFVAASGYRLDLEGIGQNEIDVWHVGTESRVDVFGRFLKACHAVTFTPDSRRLIGGGGGSESVKIWDLESRQEILTLETDHGPFSKLQFSADGTELAARSERGIYHVWRAPSWEEIERVEAGQ
ncbi:MAG: protein kinase [Verrucomicrobiales bacterium]